MPRILATAASLSLATFAALASLPACATYQDDLARGQKAFDAHDYERTLAIFRPLESDVTKLSLEDQAHYDYLRGMTDYRIGFRADARHWLELAKTAEQATPGVLLPEWKKFLADALTEMNEAVYTTGVASLVDDENAGTAEGAPVQGKTGPALPVAAGDGGADDTDASSD